MRGTGAAVKGVAYLRSPASVMDPASKAAQEMLKDSQSLRATGAAVGAAGAVVGAVGGTLQFAHGAKTKNPVEKTKGAISVGVAGTALIVGGPVAVGFGIAALIVAVTTR
jgi:hypothetical protein